MYTSVRLCDKLHGQRLVSWPRSWLRDVENLEKKEKEKKGEREREKREVSLSTILVSCWNAVFN